MTRANVGFWGWWWRMGIYFSVGGDFLTGWVPLMHHLSFGCGFRGEWGVRADICTISTHLTKVCWIRLLKSAREVHSPSNFVQWMFCLVAWINSWLRLLIRWSLLNNQSFIFSWGIHNLLSFADWCRSKWPQ